MPQQLQRFYSRPRRQQEALAENLKERAVLLLRETSGRWRPRLRSKFQTQFACPSEALTQPPLHAGSLTANNAGSWPPLLPGQALSTDQLSDVLSPISDWIQFSALPGTVWCQERHLAALSLWSPRQGRNQDRRPPATRIPELSAWMRCDNTCQVVWKVKNSHFVYLPLT